MPYTKEEHQEVAQKAARDQFGHFAKNSIPKDNQQTASQAIPPVQPPPTQTVKVQVETPRQQSTANSDSLVSLNIKNPLTVFTRSLMKAINKPMTIKIPPLYAFPILIGTLGVIPLSFFGLGKQVEKEKIASLPTPTPIVIIQPTATPVPTRFVLEKGETITFLITPPAINLSYYLNRKVLITGLYDKTKNTLQITKSGDIEVLP